MIGKLRSGARAGGLCLGIALTLGLTACASGGTPAAADSTAASSPIVAEATMAVDQYFANSNAAFNLDPVSDPNALRGKTLMYLSAGLSSPSGTAGVEALKALEAQLGFTLVTYDGQFTPSKYQEGMRQAVAQRVDALIVYGVDCAGNEAALREVHAAGIKIIGLQSVDCDEADPSAAPMFDTQPLYPIGDRSGRIGEVWAANGAAQGHPVRRPRLRGHREPRARLPRPHGAVHVVRDPGDHQYRGSGLRTGTAAEGRAGAAQASGRQCRRDQL
jgi:hypothetical protein